MAIKAIVFDIGGILIEESGSKSRELLEKKFNIHTDTFKEFAKKNLQQSFKGLHYNKFFSKLIKQLKLNLTPSQLSTEWVNARNKISVYHKEIEELIKKLRKNYNVSCNTNTTILNDKSKARIKAYRLFSFCIKSTQEKSAKPERKIYLTTIKKLKKLKIKPDEAIFIDDQHENLPPAEKLGFRTILYKNTNQLIKSLNNSGVTWQ